MLTPHLLMWEFWGPLVLVAVVQHQQVSFHKQIRGHLLEAQHIQARSQRLPMRGKEPLQMTDLKDKATRTQKESKQHTMDILSVAPGPRE